MRAAVGAPLTIAPGDRVLVPTGIVIAVPIAERDALDRPLPARREFEQKAAKTVEKVVGKAVERIFLPLMRLTIPELVDINLPGLNGLEVARVIKRRIQGFKRISRKPSITICPASVPVSVEFCPDASSAQAKRVLARLAPRTGLRSLYASAISATLWKPRV